VSYDHSLGAIRAIEDVMDHSLGAIRAIEDVMDHSLGFMMLEQLKHAM
jgi:uncharacterized protein (DUF934 family)